MKFEFKRLFNNPRLLIVLIGFFILFIFPTMISPSNSFSKEHMYQELKNQLIAGENSALDLKDIPEANHTYEAVLRSNKALENILNAYDKNSYSLLIESELEYEQLMKDRILSGTLSGLDIGEQTKRIYQLETFQTQNITRIDSFQSTIPAVNRFLRLIEIIPSTIFLIFIVIIFAYIYTSNKKKGSIDILNILPIKVWKVSFNSIFANSSYVIVSLIVSLAISIGVVTTINTLGNLEYPIFYTSFQNIYTHMPAIEFLMKFFILMLLLTFFISLTIYLVNLFSTNFIFIILIFGVLLAFSDYNMLGSAIPDSIIQYLPVGYFNIQDVLLESNRWQSEHILWSNAVLYFSIASLLLLTIISLIVNKRKKL
ncbi:hypothetical protein IW492_13930 [Enterococcus sp. BWB1-3]|uniref:hypothetical protein n=1 Tax=unclassified Enterococcus TaxID=2608891 RepID=UPI0019234471|nr:MULTISPECIES: hypothetical protein [unclassified Enterococcus]MBL1230332.1 hypothetical protein [Enterococcus sp. BWB1-3]MCB5951361.1 hypothetical protein [Enterococcus sp. BWT-B8]